MEPKLMGRIETDNVKLPKPPDMSKTVSVTVGGSYRPFRIVKAELNYDGTWDLVLEPLPEK